MGYEQARSGDRRGGVGRGEACASGKEHFQSFPHAADKNLELARRVYRRVDLAVGDRTAGEGVVHSAGEEMHVKDRSCASVRSYSSTAWGLATRMQVPFRHTLGCASGQEVSISRMVV